MQYLLNHLHNFADPCLEHDPCETVGNATIDECVTFNATAYECLYSCIEGYYPIDGIISNGCLSKLFSSTIRNPNRIFYPFKILVWSMHNAKKFPMQLWRGVRHSMPHPINAIICAIKITTPLTVLLRMDA